MTPKTKSFLLTSFTLALVAISALSMLAGFTTAALAQPAAQDASQGETLFKEKCIVCHTIGGGNLVGPDLDGVTERREVQWLAEWIRAPDMMLAAGDPIAAQMLADFNNIPMPNLKLSEAQVAALIAYLESAQGTTVTMAEQALPSGDPDEGWALFTGARRLENGGPACMSCHSIAGLGALGGGALGPDLTFAYNNYGGDNGLALYLESLPTVTMNAVWARQPLTAQEQDDLRAFLKEASVLQRPAQAVWRLVGLSTAGMAIFLVLAQIYWRKRLVAVRKPLVSRSRIST
ncbi:MAG TPA: cytochrome c [Anaerolineales bacterium]|nr:cytochrome c [Anaerolineales bacterium]